MTSSGWWLISAKDTSDIADGLLSILDNEDLPFAVRELTSSLLHILDTGTNATNAVPDDWKTDDKTTTSSD